MGKPADYQPPLLRAWPGASARIPRSPAQPCPVGPRGGAPNGNAARWWAGRRRAKGGGMLCERLLQHDPVDRLGAINLDGVLITGAPLARPPKWRRCLQAAASKFYWALPWACVPLVLGFLAQSFRPAAANSRTTRVLEMRCCRRHRTCQRSGRPKSAPRAIGPAARAGSFLLRLSQNGAATLVEPAPGQSVALEIRVAPVAAVPAQSQRPPVP